MSGPYKPLSRFPTLLSTLGTPRSTLYPAPSSGLLSHVEFHPSPALHHLPCPPLQPPVPLCSGAQFHNTRCLPHLGVCAFLPLSTCRTPKPAAGPSPELPGSPSPSPGVTRACLCQHLWKWRCCLPFCPEGPSGRMVFFLCFPCSSSDSAGRQGWASACLFLVEWIPYNCPWNFEGRSSFPGRGHQRGLFPPQR